ncbi:T9SS type A sorting domain-containing protein [Mangrovivirga sp. M17]|uniref:T9SS type A sorting domain-containing protein n=1 Tax=Mangrovivirga halotolerans TaxID=2993936 RepID=A0ABT3RP75_9BACT|nr:choice-of-anchor tandem repeat GloVer-containing protein [Mangrovivirga halotolerans]MCX2743584.1 T9SS type A sorting domain-containing protein [Mangrovivirga halotolerans]
MKRTILLNILFVILSSFINTTIAQQQESFWGVSASGGEYEYGNLYRYTNNGGFEVIHNFYDELRSLNIPEFPYVLQTSDNKFYGIINHGGKYGRGFVYEFDYPSKTLRKVADVNELIDNSSILNRLIGPIDNKIWGKNNSTNYLYSINIETGEIRNELALDDNHSAKYIDHSLKNDTIFIFNSNKIMKLDPYTGDSTTTFFEHHIFGQPTRIDDSTYIGYGLIAPNNGDIHLIKFNINSGKSSVLLNVSDHTVDNRIDLKLTKDNYLLGILFHHKDNSPNGAFFKYNLENNSIEIFQTSEYFSHFLNPIQTLDSISYYFVSDLSRGRFFKLNTRTNEIILDKELNDSIGFFNPRSAVFPVGNNKLVGISAIKKSRKISTNFFEYNIETKELSAINYSNPAPILGSKPGYISKRNDGKLIIATNTGGQHDNGTLLEYDTLTGDLNKLFDFLKPISQPKYLNKNLYFFSQAHNYLYKLNTETSKTDSLTLEIPEKYNSVINLSSENNILYGYNISKDIIQEPISVNFYKLDTINNTFPRIDRLHIKTTTDLLDIVFGKNEEVYLSLSVVDKCPDYCKTSLLLRYDIASTKIDTLLNSRKPGINHYSFDHLLAANDGNLYGIANVSGNNAIDDHIFKFDISSKTIETVIGGEENLSINNRIYANGNFIYCVSPPLFENFGLIYNYNIISNQSNLLYKFNYEDGTGLSYLTGFEPKIILEENEENKNIKLHPNPSTGKFTIQFLNDYKTKYIEIFNLDGIKVFEQKYQDTNPIKLDLMLKPGIYIIKFTLDDSDTVVQKIIIQ